MHIEFPRCLHGAGGKTLIVHNEADRDRELANGWSLRPVVDSPAPTERPTLTYTPLAEYVAEAVAAAPKKRRKPAAH